MREKQKETAKDLRRMVRRDEERWKGRDRSKVGIG